MMMGRLKFVLPTETLLATFATELLPLAGSPNYLIGTRGGSHGAEHYAAAVLKTEKLYAC
jgi:hypothetical protein